MNRLKKTLKAVGIGIFSLALIVAIVFTSLAIFVYKDINFEADERLFEGARSFDSTTFYAMRSAV